MKITVGRTYRFRAIHCLPDFPDPWCWPHQHDYTVELTAEGGVDTVELDRAMEPIVQLEGQNMNEFFNPSTVEHIAERLLEGLPQHVLALVVWEDRQRWGRAER